MKVQLFNPPSHHYQGVHYRMNPPLGLPILSAVLRAAGHECEVVDLEALGVNPERLGQAWAAQRDRWPDVVGITALSSSARGARESIAALRSAGYDRPIMVGGPHATLAPEEPLAWGADLSVIGECEGNIVALCEAAITGEWFARGPVQGKPMPIEQIPAPDWTHHNPAPTAYGGNAPHIGQPEGIAMFSRGCPHNCVFCGNPVFGQSKKRFRPPAAIVEEMADLKRRHVKAVFVYDDEIVGTLLPDGWLAEVADGLQPLGLVWKTQGRCSERNITPAVMADLHRAGCRVVMWGVESFSQSVLDANRKGTSVADIWHSLRTAKQAGIANWVFSMVGLYGETDADAALTAAGLEQGYAEGLIDYRQTTVTTVMPGTELHKRAVAEGWYVPSPESGPQMNQVYTSTPWMTAERIGYWVRRYSEVCPVDYRGRAA